MNLNDFLIFTLEDILLLAALFVVFILVSGSLLHLVMSEHHYRKWNKKQATKQTKKRPRKTNRVTTKSKKKTARPTKASRTTRKTKA